MYQLYWSYGFTYMSASLSKIVQIAEESVNLDRPHTFSEGL